jgi:hypothetical protein
MPVIHISLYSSVYDSVLSINYSYLCKIFVKQSHEYVCLILRKTWINVYDISETWNYVPRQNEGEDFLRLDICIRW